MNNDYKEAIEHLTLLKKEAEEIPTSVPTPEIFELQKKIDEALLPMFPKEKKFESHVTLARIKFVANNKDYIDKIQRLKIDDEKFQVKDFLLVKSTLMPDGPIYEIISKFSAR